MNPCIRVPAPGPTSRSDDRIRLPAGYRVEIFPGQHDRTGDGNDETPTRLQIPALLAKDLALQVPRKEQDVVRGAFEEPFGRADGNGHPRHELPLLVRTLVGDEVDQ